MGGAVDVEIDAGGPANLSADGELERGSCCQKILVILAFLSGALTRFDCGVPIGGGSLLAGGGCGGLVSFSCSGAWPLNLPRPHPSRPPMVSLDRVHVREATIFIFVLLMKLPMAFISRFLIGVVALPID